MISLVMRAAKSHSSRILRKIKTKLQKKLVKFVAKVSYNLMIIINNSLIIKHDSFET